MKTIQCILSSMYVYLLKFYLEQRWGPEETPKSIPHHQKALYICFILKLIICIKRKIVILNHVFAFDIKYILLITAKPCCEVYCDSNKLISFQTKSHLCNPVNLSLVVCYTFSLLFGCLCIREEKLQFFAYCLQLSADHWLVHLHIYTLSAVPLIPAV